ncbi:MAG TPA: AcrB/AcrD/AcrF family protein, partial [Ectothiorhodospiraceae bacterium]|nr:AcrB/AcrD/AcrF family protein [Ectothiorhodospiraceae bacterium]
YGASANEKVNSLLFKLFIATGAVGILILYFLGFRPAIVVLMIIPVVIVFTVFAAWIMGFTIDRVSLFALIFCIGILVDDAIVVVENIYRRWLAKGEMSTEIAVDAVREVGNPTILATFTVIAALLPMGAVSGMMGPYMAPIPALGSVAMIVSLLAAFVFTPWLAMRIKPSMEQLHKAEAKEERSADRLERLFRGILMPIIGNKKIGYLTLGFILFLFFAVCMLFYTNAVRVKMLPLDNKPEYSIVIDMPEGTALPDTANLISRLVEVVRKYPEVVALQSYVGTAQPFDFNGMVRHYYMRHDPWQAEIHVQLVHKSKRDKNSHELAIITREAIAPLVKEVGARATVVEMPPGPPVLQAMVAEIYGPDDETRRAVAQHMTDTFDRAAGVGDVDNYMAEEYNVWRFEVDAEKAVRRGISVDTINRNLSMAMGGHVLGDIKQGNVLDPTRIVIQIPLEVRSEIARLGDLPIPSTNGTTVPLAELGYFKQVKQDPIIYHKDLRPVEYVVGEAVGRLAAPIYGMFEVEDLLKDYTTPDGVKLKGSYFGVPDDDGTSAFEWAGEWTVTLETFAGMGGAFGVAIILIYILVVWEFGNFTIPAIIMAPIPLTLIGIIPGHWLLDAEFTATSMIGFIALAGIIVRNSILLVDYTTHKVQEGVDVRDAVIMACKTRTRPIIITAFALVGGSSVILTDYIFQGMAISLLFGVLVSTILTLIVIPLGCISARSAFCPAGSECEQLVNECECDDVPSESKLSVTDFGVGIWRLFVMMLKGAGFKLYQLIIGAVFSIIGLISSFRSKPEPINQTKPVVTEPVVNKTSTEPAEIIDTTSAEPIVEPASDQHEQESNSLQSESPPEESKSAAAKQAVPAPILEAFEEKSQAAPAETVESASSSTPAATDTVIKKRVVKKKVVKKKIAVKRVAPKKKVAIKKKSAVSKSGERRRGIRLNRNFDDFDI